MMLQFFYAMVIMEAMKPNVMIEKERLERWNHYSLIIVSGTEEITKKLIEFSKSCNKDQVTSKINIIILMEVAEVKIHLHHKIAHQLES